MTRKRIIGGVALTVAAVLTVVAGVLIRDFVTTPYAGYEVGLVRGTIIVVGVLAVTGWVVGVVMIRSAQRDASGR